MVSASAPLSGQQSPFGGDPAAQASELQRTGVKKEVGRVTAWFPRDSLSDARMTAITARLDSGVRAIVAVIGPARGWQRDRDETVTYFFPAERFISHGGPLGVFIPYWRMKADSAPPAHDAVHILLAPSRTPTWRANWLIEGIADYLGQIATDRAGVHADFDVFDEGGQQRVDESCRARAGTSGGRAILPFIGALAPPPNLVTDREHVAKPFYTCANSFVKYLVSQYGLDEVLGWFAQTTTPPTKIHGRELSSVRADWLRAIGLSQ